MQIGSILIRIAIVAGVVTIIAWNHAGQAIAIFAGSATALAMWIYYRKRARVEAD